MLRKLILPSVLLMLSFGLKAQNLSQTPKEQYIEAESYYLFEEFRDALPIYLRLYKMFPQHYNLAFKIGRCYYEDPYNKEKSISFLETASNHISKEAKPKQFKETEAPPEALFYLGNAYRVNKKFNEAIEAYNDFLKLADPEKYDFKLVNDQIQSCKNVLAERENHSSIHLLKHNVSEYFNDRFSQTHPVISGDGNSFVYVSELQFYDAVFYSVKVDGEWQPPRNLIPELKVDGDIYPTALNFDGSEMYIYRSDNYDGNIWVASLKNGMWQNLRKLGDNINTKFWESHASVNKEGDELYFSSNREGGYGELDIYVSELSNDNTWGVARNLGDVINSRYNDDSPYITMNNDRLYFKSYGHKNYGGYDILFSERNNNISWRTPINPGIALNSSDDETFFMPFQNGDYIYLSRYVQGNKGRRDILLYEVFSENHPRIIDLVLDLRKLKEEANAFDAKLTLKRTLDNEVIQSIDLIHASERMQIDLPHGEYLLELSAENLKTETRTIHIPINITNPTLTLKPVFDLIVLNEETDSKEFSAKLNISNADSDLENDNLAKPREVKRKMQSDEINLTSNESIPLGEKTTIIEENDTMPSFANMAEENDMDESIVKLVNAYYHRMFAMYANESDFDLKLELLSSGDSLFYENIERSQFIKIIQSLIENLDIDIAELDGIIEVSSLTKMNSILDSLTQRGYNNSDLLNAWIEELKIANTQINSELRSLFNFLVTEDLYQRLIAKMQHNSDVIAKMANEAHPHDIISLLDYFIDYLGSADRLKIYLEELLADQSAEVLSKEVAGANYYKLGVYIALGAGLLYLVFLVFRRRKSKRERDMNVE